MSTVDQHIHNTDAAICDSITALKGDRSLLSRAMLSQLRNLVEGAAVRVHSRDGQAEYTYDAIQAALIYVASAPKAIQLLHRFHKLLQESVSHYTMDGDTSERLMLKYYEYLIRVRNLLRREFTIEILSNLEQFPVNLDPSLGPYHQMIADRIDAMRASSTPGGTRNRYYIHGVRPFFVKGRIFYEVVFRNSTDRMNKVDRVIAFTDIDMTDKYAANLTVTHDAIQVIGQTMPISIILDWEVSIRPCEFNNFARLLGIQTKAQSPLTEYRVLNQYLTATASGLLDVIALPDEKFKQLRDTATQKAQKPQIFPALEKARALISKKGAGHNVIRLAMLRMNNVILKRQYSPTPWAKLSNLNLQWGCKPFDDMPFCTSPVGGNVRFADLVESLDAESHKHEILARRLKVNVEQHGMLYTPVDELESFGDLAPLITQHNNALYFKHRPRRDLELDKKHLFIHGYEDDTAAIIKKLQSYAIERVDGYTEAVQQWLDENTQSVDDPVKVQALKLLFAKSQVALIYGAAGTGKSTMIDHIANFFNDKEKLFLAHTNPAVNNLERRVSAQKSSFSTIAGHLRRQPAIEYDVLFIDECSTVSNAKLLEVLEKTSFKLLVLVGDVYQIESIEFGNWFELAPAFIPKTSVFELTNPYRTKNSNLLKFWTAVRKTATDTEEVMAHFGYSTQLNESLFEPQGKNEIILCLNYDGLYGINNINRFLQSSNSGKAANWGVSTYKIGDPVLFGDTDRFRGVIYNNLKGTLVGIAKSPGKIQFDVSLDRVITELDVWGTELEWLGDSTVRFAVFERGSTDEDDEPLASSVPFQVAYAVSIHKAQGLEYDSVKVVITDANEDEISHSVFYTAVTRARERLRIFWTPETQQAILGKLERPSRNRDLGLLSARQKLKVTSVLTS
jgi:energy-coupling factor transporter ATP-binding protein EcfA2